MIVINLMLSHLIWIGDLNYRVTMADTEAKDLISQGQFVELLKHDQVFYILIHLRLFLIPVCCVAYDRKTSFGRSVF